MLDLLLKSIEKAQQRTRKAFFLLLLVSSLVLIFAFNFSIAQGNVKPPHSDDSEEYKIKLQAYFNRYTYSIPIIGVAISSDDFVFFGPLALFIFSFYFVSCSRNSENEMKSLVQRNDLVGDDLQMVAMGLSSEVVLNTSSHNSFGTGWHERLIHRLSLQEVNLYQVLILIPFAAALAAMASEIRATYFLTVFVPVHEPGRPSCTDSVDAPPALSARKIEPPTYYIDSQGKRVEVAEAATPCPPPQKTTFYRQLEGRYAKARVISFEVLGGILILTIGAFSVSGILYARSVERLIADIVSRAKRVHEGS